MALKRKNHLTREEVQHIAWLSNIKISKEEEELFTEQFNRILKYFALIDDAKTEAVPPTYHFLELVNIFRKDEVEKSLPKEKSLENASKKENGFFKSPRIIQEDGKRAGED